MSADERWSLRRRAGLAFAATASAFLLVVGAASVGAYAWILEGELDEELEEQLVGIRGRCAADEPGAEALAAVLRPSVDADVETPMAFVARDPAGDVVFELGPEPLLASLAPGDPPSVEVDRRPRSVRRIAWTAPGGFEVWAALDGRDWTRRVRTVGTAIGAIVFAGAALSLLAGRAFGARLARWLEDVAQSVERGAGDAPLASGIPGAPDEIRAVAEALDGKLRATAAEVERAGLLSSGLAHDLRAPIQAMLTGAQVTMSRLAPDDPTTAQLRLHEAELRALAKSVDNIVAWGAPRTRAVGGARIAFDLAAELEGRLRAEEETAAARGILIDILARGDTSLEGDPDALVLAVRNLVGNAVAWSPDGGQVTVTLDGRGAALVVTVDDEGTGVAPADRERIFAPFVRGATAPGRRAGYGLGLAIVRAAAERAGGSARVTGAPGGGARLTLELARRAVT